MASKQLNRDAVPWEPNKVPHRQPLPAPVPPPAVTYQYPTNYYYISDQCCYYYYYYHYSYYCSSYKNTTTNHHSAVIVDPSSEGSGQYGVVLRSSGERKVMETYKRSVVMRFEGGGGPTNFGGGVRSGVVPPRFRGRFVEGRLRRTSSFGFQWKPKTIYKSGGHGASGGGGGNVSCEVALDPTPAAGGGGGERVGCGGGASGCGGEVSCEVGLAPTPGGGGGGGGDESCGGKTTVMIKNIPNQYRRHMLVDFIDKLCEKNQLEYDFLYLPMDFQRKNSLGYAFVNFTSAAAATRIRELLQGYKWGCIQTHCGSFSSNKICEVTYARIQGKEALVQNFANSTFCCNNYKWLPVVFTPPRNGLSSSGKPRIIGKCRARISY